MENPIKMDDFRGGGEKPNLWKHPDVSMAPHRMEFLSSKAASCLPKVTEVLEMQMDWWDRCTSKSVGSLH